MTDQIQIYSNKWNASSWVKSYTKKRKYKHMLEKL